MKKLFVVLDFVTFDLSAFKACLNSKFELNFKKVWNSDFQKIKSLQERNVFLVSACPKKFELSEFIKKDTLYSIF